MITVEGGQKVESEGDRDSTWKFKWHITIFGKAQLYSSAKIESDYNLVVMKCGQKLNKNNEYTLKKDIDLDRLKKTDVTLNLDRRRHRNSTKITAQKGIQKKNGLH